MSELHPGPSSRLSHCICKSKTALGRSITPGAGQTVQVVGVLDLVCILKVPLRIPGEGPGHSLGHVTGREA